MVNELNIYTSVFISVITLGFAIRLGIALYNSK